MAFESFVWNVNGAFNDEQSARVVLEQVAEAKPDVAVFPEAYRHDGENALLDHVVERLDRDDYEVVHGPYAEGDWRSILGIVRRNRMVMLPRLIENAGRYAVSMMVEADEHQQAHVVGMHGYDRYEIARLRQSADMVELPDVIAMDGNAMYANDWRARLLRPMAGISRLLPNADLDHTVPMTPWERWGSILPRLVGMADGRTMETYHKAGYQDADPDRLPTFKMAGVPTFQLDHLLLAQRRFTVVPDSFQRLKSAASDHYGVMACIMSNDEAYRTD